MTRNLFMVVLLTFVKVNNAEEGGEPSFFSIKSGIPDPQTPWPNKTVIYELEINPWSHVDEGEFNRVKTEIRKQTCIRFKERSTETDFLLVTNVCVDHCSNQVGKKGGPQFLNLGYNCNPEPSRRFYLHDLLHALGFHHEHNRYDRDLFVTINSENIRPDLLKYFNKINSSEPWQSTIPYDYKSVMHFGRKQFAIRDYKETITPLVADVVTGNHNSLSVLDVQKINKKYCPGTIGIRLKNQHSKFLSHGGGAQVRAFLMPLNQANYDQEIWTVDWHAMKNPSRGSTLTSWLQLPKKDAVTVASEDLTTHNVMHWDFTYSFNSFQKWRVQSVPHPTEARWHIINMATNRCLSLEPDGDRSFNRAITLEVYPNTTTCDTWVIYKR